MPELGRWRKSTLVKTTPAQARAHFSAARAADQWVPAFAGMEI